MDFRKVRSLLNEAKPREIAYDLALADGLCARIAADGVTKTLYWRGRNVSGANADGGKKRGKVIRVKLGNYPPTRPGKTDEGAAKAQIKCLEEAAAKALQIKTSVKNGIDPNLKERRERAGADRPATVREAAERFKNGHLDAKVGQKWNYEARRILDKEILPKIGAHQLADVRRDELTTLIDKKAAKLKKAGKTGVAANRIAAVLGVFFGYCTDKGWIAANPGFRIRKSVVETPRERVLTAVEIGAAWAALQDALRGEQGSALVYSRILALLAVTGCRASEITGLRRQDVDLDAGTIEIVKGKTESSSRILPVGATARAMLVAAVEEMKAREPGALIFPRGNAGKVIDSSDISKTARAMVATLKHRPWTPHDLRRSLVTQTKEMGFEGGIVRRIAGHVGRDAHEAVYDRSRQLDKMRDALEQYEKYILKCAADLRGPENNVISLRNSA